MKPTLYSILILMLSGCGSGSSKKGGSGGAVETATAPDAQGIVSYGYQPTATGPQIVTIGKGTPLAGTQVTLAPGTLALPANILLEEGGSTPGSISEALGITETPTAASAAVIVRTADPTVIPTSNLAISLPIGTSSLALVQNKLVVLGLYWTSSGLKAGLLGPEKLAVADGKAKFSTPYFGQYQLAYVADVPSKTEASATAGIVTKKEASVPQTLYIVGSKKSDQSPMAPEIGGYYKNDTWMPIPLPAGAESFEASSIKFREGKMYIGGSLYTRDTNDLRVSAPGLWIDGIWNALKVPEGYSSCNYFDFAFDANGKVHATANCLSSNIQQKAVFWDDGISRVELDTAYGTSADAKGNIYRTMERGYFLNDAYQVLSEDEAFTVFARPVIAKNADTYITGWKLLDTGSYEYGYFLNKVWTRNENKQVDYLAFTAGDELVRAGVSASGAFIKKGTLTTSLECAIAAGEPMENAIEVDGVVLDRDGNTYVSGKCSKRGYWKNGKFTNLENFTAYDFILN